MSKEIWKDLPKYEGLYQASNMGRVRSLDRYRPHGKTKTKQFRKGKLLKPGYDGRYFSISLFKNGVKTQKSRWLHQVIAETFLGPRPEGLHCAHKNGDSRDNRVSNLKWCTRQENEEDKKRHGRIVHGEKHQWSKLTEKDVLRIRKMYKPPPNGLSCLKIGKLFNVGDECIRSIIIGETWKHI